MTPVEIIALIDGALRLVALGVQAAQNLKATAELTPEQEAELDAAIDKALTATAWHKSE